MSTAELTPTAGAEVDVRGDVPAEVHGNTSGIPNAKLGMWMFLSSECLFFGAFIAANLLYRGKPHGTTKTPADVYNIPFTSATSFVLLMSSLTMVLALAAIQRGEYRRLRIWLLTTGFFGLIFIGAQIYEFTEFYREGVELSTNVQSTSFFILTGIHGLHVTVGIIWLVSLWGLSVQGRLRSGDSEKIEIAGLYWHFVDIIWIIIFTVIYLIPTD